MNCPKPLTENIAIRLGRETALSEESIQIISSYLEGESTRAPDWNIILKPPVVSPESCEP
jgi:hypothetical protein